MKRLSLAEVSLCAVDARAPELAWQALRRSMSGVDFGRVVLFTHDWRPARAEAGIEVVDVGPIDSGLAYSRFVLRRLADHIDTSHVLVTQWDGFVADATAWDARFLEFDYIGAPWADKPAATSVGNGGFSLRSRRLLAASRDARIVDEHPEDEMLCIRYRALLECEHGVRFAPPALARRFAFENAAPEGPCFGFHGPHNLPRFLDDVQMSSCLAALPDAFFRGRDARRLARALLAAGRPALVREVVRRRIAVGRGEPSTRLLGLAAAMWAPWRERGPGG